MSKILFSPEHSWALLDGQEATVGVSDFAQGALGLLVYVDLPGIGSRIERNEPCGMLESAKTASDVIAPVSGQVIAVNNAVLDDPELINRAPLMDGWLLRVVPDKGWNASLMDAAAYAVFVAAP
jgi:glycine cleavage system H protein